MKACGGGFPMDFSMVVGCGFMVVDGYGVVVLLWNMRERERERERDKKKRKNVKNKRCC